MKKNEEKTQLQSSENEHIFLSIISKSTQFLGYVMILLAKIHVESSTRDVSRE